ncbi:glutamine-hydrolyzing carbamoyl-phosphate synthase small subunit [Brevibacterium luteolum]|uniref:Carbamoyl phosphate synthase small chain n=1 Tax=Brevibacterium luteolum TaxID=199591 RepID=A0A849B1V7_9MICO|nr:glutamine-hydrolyzing carbamoyl-phosphate synthase small subunit [Brevibacterium luteolum]MBM7528559.1 carbamoyl-phosphate synthase small subunit [Brevibacterium luteolum]NNG79236.1 glutamine-hydrolyzing carbamoyl-phosphate synthase small subunit [Brevibacterium luteolum]
MTLHQRPPAVLVLDDGRTLTGRAYGAEGSTTGEAVFVTSMTGYQETLTDPSYRRQIVIQTMPHIGNTGVNDEDDESRDIWVAGYVVRDAARRRSNWRATGDLEARLADRGIVGITDIDTRALTRHLRDKGAMRAGIFSGPEAQRPNAELLAEVRAAEPMAGANLSAEVTCEQPYTIPAEGEKKHSVVAYDLGIKTTTLDQFAARGIETTVVPADFTFEQLTELDPDGVFFSNGPGDPASVTNAVDVLARVLEAKIPFFGICFGNQLLGRALGFETYKLPFGHRGSNQPVLDTANGRVHITTQNHGFAVDAPLRAVVTAPAGEHLGRVEVSYIGLNDDVVEGLRCLDLPAFSVQFHPESAAGPHDARDLFDRFIELLDGAATVTPSIETSEGDNAHA